MKKRRPTEEAADRAGVARTPAPTRQPSRALQASEDSSAAPIEVNVPEVLSRLQSVSASSPAHLQTIVRELMAVLGGREARFVALYLNEPNATKAYMTAGYKCKNANVAAVEGHKLLRKPKIQAVISAVNHALSDASVSTAIERRRTLTEIHRARPGDFMTVGANGVVPNLGPENINAAGLKEVEIRVEYSREGSAKKEVGYVAKIKFHDPVTAIKELNEMEGVYPPKKPNVDLRSLAVFEFVYEDGGFKVPEQLTEGEDK
jgi:phage terminase small subunit